MAHASNPAGAATATERHVNTMQVDNSRTHPVYLNYFQAEREYRAAFDAHQKAEYPSDYETAKAWLNVLELQCKAARLYITLIESNVQPIDYHPKGM
jgi:hypothetical protein